MVHALQQFGRPAFWLELCVSWLPHIQILRGLAGRSGGAYQFEALRNRHAVDGYVCWNSTRRLPFIVYRPKKTNFRLPFPFSANKWKFAVSVFFRSVFLIYIQIKWIGSICCRFKWKTEALAKFLNPLTVCSSCPFMVIYLLYSTCKWSNYASESTFFVRGEPELRALLHYYTVESQSAPPFNALRVIISYRCVVRGEVMSIF
jgi:hypothetical protein